MIHSITITNHQSESLRLVLRNPGLSGVIVESVEGLSPPQSTINTIEMANMDGSIFTSARAGARNIVFKLLMMDQCPGAKTIEESRHIVYKYFPIKKEIRMDFETDTRISQIWGYVESNDATIFSEKEGCQVSVVCPDPWFYAPALTSTAYSGVEPLFEFPFENDSLTEDLLFMGEMHEDTTATFSYSGDVDTGVIMSINARGDAKNITIFDRTTQETMKIDTDKIKTITGITFSAGDSIEISTRKGQKYAHLIHQGIASNVIAAIAKESDWFELTIGRNTFGFEAEEGIENLNVSFQYRNAYGGV